ncbi:hypothetical protein X943_003678 [Babesia divergens]|uniref:Uncharacterized protein n=1 Tax=Babesia divergens TaxID=32595 RepID=A0AAD9LGG1_BABDI|nr:hypothetical protein X943_003678 [Babesia divergens]
MATGKAKKIGGGMGCGMGILGTIKVLNGILKGLTGIRSRLPIDPLNKSRREFRLRIQGLSKFPEKTKELKKILRRLKGNVQGKLKKPSQRVKTVVTKDMEDMSKVKPLFARGGEI